MLKLTLTDMQALAAERRGYCVSDTYVNNRTPLKWQCAEGHKWQAAPADIRSGHWCPICAAAKRADDLRSSLTRMRQIAAEFGGECLAETYINNSTPLRWRCAEGHEWETAPKTVLRGSWCPMCARSCQKKSQNR